MFSAFACLARQLQAVVHLAEQITDRSLADLVSLFIKTGKLDCELFRPSLRLLKARLSMCGIAGILAPGQYDGVCESVERMNDQIAHRGPDGHGVEAYSIGTGSIDLLSAQQGLVNADKLRLAYREYIQHNPRVSFRDIFVPSAFEMWMRTFSPWLK